MLSMFENRKVRRFVVQVTFLMVIMSLVGGAIYQGQQNIAARGMTSGFEFLTRATGFDIGFKLIDYTPYSSYGRLIMVGLLNTLFLGILGIVLANVVGLIIAILRTARNETLNILGTVYIEIFRNIPMILQAVFWYALLTQLPPPKQAFYGFGSYLSSRGLYLPGLNVTGGSAAIFFLCLFVALIALMIFAMSRRFSRVPHSSRRAIRLGLLGAGVAAGVIALHLGRIVDTPLVSLPELRGMNIREGIRVSPEFVALLVAMATYGGAYIAEIIRAGFLSVGKGQVEAAQSLGLTPWQVFSRVHLPLAFRAVLPTLINQYVWLFKATTLGIAVGYTDFFAVISVSINQAGQTLELIGILMLGFLVINNSIAFVLNRLNKAIALKGNQLRS
ncbi:ABC transporter permease subunit [Cypionkella sp.]|uniref:amino acid ABC transporter permease n=1 Tax=Cypionkella sp. TaxID=2811411 RepID=UPI002AC9BD4F|nr:ABC transporter permease subunit [Cypionkella sp.]